MLLIINIHSLSHMILYEANPHKPHVTSRRDLQIHHFAARVWLILPILVAVNTGTPSLTSDNSLA